MTRALALTDTLRSLLKGGQAVGRQACAAFQLTPCPSRFHQASVATQEMFTLFRE